MKELCLAIIFLSPPLQAETIFHKPDASEISPEEHKILYKLVLKNQFPACMLFGSYVTDELKAMNSAIKNELPESGIQASFMPTTLYDLFVIYFAYKTGRENTTYNINPDNFKSTVKNKTTMSFHRTINNYIITSLKERSLPIPKSTRDSLFILDSMDELFRYLGSSAEKGDRRNGRAMIKRAIEIDHMAYHAHKYPLYRAAEIVDVANDINSRGSRWYSLSFGSSLLGGYFNDHSACTFRIIMDNFDDLVAYVLYLDKKSYVDGALKNMFFIPPLIALIDLYGEGEFFHTRAKVPSLGEARGLIQTFSHQSKWNNLYEISARSPEHAEEIYRYIRTFIKNHHTMLTGDSPVKLPQRPNKPLPPFPTGKTVKRYPAPQQPLPAFPQKEVSTQKK